MLKWHVEILYVGEIRPEKEFRHIKAILNKPYRESCYFCDTQNDLSFAFKYITYVII